MERGQGGGIGSATGYDTDMRCMPQEGVSFSRQRHTPDEEYGVYRFGIYDVALAIWVERSGTVYAVLCDVLFCEKNLIQFWHFLFR